MRSIHVSDPRIVKTGDFERQTSAYTKIAIETACSGFRFDLVTMSTGETKKILQQILDEIAR